MESRHLSVSFFTHAMMMKVMNCCWVWGSEDVEVMENGPMTCQFVHVRHPTIKWMKICADNFITANKSKFSGVNTTVFRYAIQTKFTPGLTCTDTHTSHTMINIFWNQNHFMNMPSLFFPRSRTLGNAG